MGHQSISDHLQPTKPQMDAVIGSRLDTPSYPSIMYISVRLSLCICPFSSVSVRFSLCICPFFSLCLFVFLSVSVRFSPCVCLFFSLYLSDFLTQYVSKRNEVAEDP